MLNPSVEVKLDTYGNSINQRITDFFKVHLRGEEVYKAQTYQLRERNQRKHVNLGIFHRGIEAGPHSSIVNEQSSESQKEVRERVLTSLLLGPGRLHQYPQQGAFVRAKDLNRITIACL